MSKPTTTYIEEDVFYCKSLTCIDKLIYSCLMAHTVPKNRLMSNLSIKKISKVTGITDNTVIDSLKHLESEGFLTIIREAYYNKYLFRSGIEKPVIVPIEWITTQDFDVKTKMCYLLLLNTKDRISLSEITELLNIKKCADESIDKLLHAGLIKEFFLTEIIKIDKKSADRLFGDLFKHLSDGKPDINGIKSLLSTYYKDKILAEKFTSKIVLSYTLDMLVNMLSDCR